jgi:hypothetical protein
MADYIFNAPSFKNREQQFSFCMEENKGANTAI